MPQMYGRHSSASPGRTEKTSSLPSQHFCSQCLFLFFVWHMGSSEQRERKRGISRQAGLEIRSPKLLFCASFLEVSCPLSNRQEQESRTVKSLDSGDSLSQFQSVLASIAIIIIIIYYYDCPPDILRRLRALLERVFFLQCRSAGNQQGSKSIPR